MSSLTLSLLNPNIPAPLQMNYGSASGLGVFMCPKFTLAGFLFVDENSTLLVAERFGPVGLALSWSANIGSSWLNCCCRGTSITKSTFHEPPLFIRRFSPHKKNVHQVYPTSTSSMASASIYCILYCQAPILNDYWKDQNMGC